MSRAINIPIADAVHPFRDHIITTDTDSIIRIEVQNKYVWDGGKSIPSPKGEKEYSVVFVDGRSFSISKVVYNLIKREKYGK